MRKPLILLAMAPITLFAVACGSKSSDRSPATQNAQSTSTSDSPVKVDRDKDSDGGPQDDTGDSIVLDFGHPAHLSDRQAITALVRRYYSIAVNERGEQACSLIATPLSKSVAEDYGQSPGPLYARGKTCHAVMRLFFKHFHTQLAERYTKLEISHVQVANNRGLAVLTFGAMPERQIPVVREGATWKVESILDYDVP